MIGRLIKLSVQTFQPLNAMYRRSNWGYIYQFIGHCLIPLESCINILIYLTSIATTGGKMLIIEINYMLFNDYIITVFTIFVYHREGGDIRLFITLVPKVL